jgi:glucokinase
MLLAGDVGGTKTLLGVFTRAPARPAAIDVRTFKTLDYPGLGAMLDGFLADGRFAQKRIEAAAFGVAGPVVGRTARLSNVPWTVEAAEVASRFSIPHVALLNDLAAMAHAVAVLEGDELAVLQQGRRVEDGNAALIAAGTGLGEALLHRVDGRFIPAPSEGGHADFAARTAREIALLQFLQRPYGRVECERVLSGPGLLNLFAFTHPDGCVEVPRQPDGTVRAADVSASALAGRCERCVDTLEMFVSAYGAEAGNLALRSVATAGVFLGGGIAPKILPALQTGTFLDAFRSKPPMTEMLSAMPVSVILNTQAGLLGAAVYANGL